MKWKTLSPDERTALSTKCENGNWQQLVHLFTQSLMVVVYQVASTPDKNGLDLNLKWKPLSYNHKRQMARWEWLQDLHGFSRQEYPAYSFAGRLQETIFKISRPAFGPLPMSLCHYHWLHGYDWFDGESFLPGDKKIAHTIECKTPTMHEFMEAQLELRDFLRPHLSSEEIEALFIP